MNLRNKIFDRLDKLVKYSNITERRCISEEIKDIINDWIAETEAKMKPI